jgi:hypothetical protein
MSLEIRSTNIDLHKHKIRRWFDEQQAIFSIESQILQWLKDAGDEKAVLGTRSSSLLINKLMYFISERLEKTNPSLVISRGWYKFGPCFEHGRQGEESMSLFAFDKHKPVNTILPEVSQECELQVPRYLKSLERDGSFPYGYINYVYSERCNYPWLQNYYLAKHNLSKLLSDMDIKDVKEKELNKAFIEFDRAVLDSKYRNKINISSQEANRVLEISSLTSYMAADKKKYGEYFNNIRHYFTENVLLTFAMKNYENTFHTSNIGFEKIIAENMENNYKNYMAEIPEKLRFYYSIAPVDA